MVTVAGAGGGRRERYAAKLGIFYQINQSINQSNQSTFVERHKSRANRRRVKRKARPSGYRKLWQKVPSLSTFESSHSQLVDRQQYGSEFHTEGELRLKDFADVVRDIRGSQ